MKKLVWTLLVIFSCGGALGQNPSTACIVQLGEDARLQTLFIKVPLDISRGQSLEVLASQSKPTKKEQLALSILLLELDRCTALGIDWRKLNYPASINGYMDAYQSFVRSAIAELYLGKLTFGDFAKARDRERTESLNKVSIEFEQIQARRAGEKRQQEQQANLAEEQRRATALKSAEQAEAQRRYVEQETMRAKESRRQAALQYFFNQRLDQPIEVQLYQIPKQPYQMPMPMPSTTNCRTFGNHTNCTTQ